MTDKESTEKKSIYDDAVLYMTRNLDLSEEMAKVLYLRFSNMRSRKNIVSEETLTPVMIGDSVRSRVVKKDTKYEKAQDIIKKVVESYYPKKNRSFNRKGDNENLISILSMFGVRKTNKLICTIASCIPQKEILDRYYSEFFSLADTEDISGLLTMDENYSFYLSNGLAFAKHIVRILIIEEFIDEYIRASQTEVPFSDFKYEEFMRKDYEDYFSDLHGETVEDLYLFKHFAVRIEKKVLADLVSSKKTVKEKAVEEKTVEDLETPADVEKTPVEVEIKQEEVPTPRKVGLINWIRFFLFGIN